jgi:hypothetical protein
LLPLSVLACQSPAAPCPATPVGAAASAPSADPPAGAPARARYRSVHIDTLDPDKVAQFIDARRAWVEELRRDDATDGRGVFLEVPSAKRFITVRAFSSFTSLDTRGAVIKASLARVPKEAGERYDHLSDTALVFPHTSEIWELDDDLSYVPRAGALDEATAACGSLVIEDVRPSPSFEEAYDKARHEINAALAQASYPLTRLTFETRYGAGHVWSLILAASREALDAQPHEVDVVARILGAARAHELDATLSAAVQAREVQAFTVRHDLTWRPVP